MIGIVASGRSVVIHAGGGCHGYEVIRPLGVAERLHRKGEWVGAIRLGEAAHSAGVYEVIVVGQPRSALEPGAHLDNWPAAAARSDLLVLTKKTPTQPIQSASAKSAGCSVKLIEPESGPVETASRIDLHARLDGCQGDSVWFIVHSLDVSTYFVQPRASKRGSKAWVARGYLGRRGRDWGVPFEVRAIVNPTMSIREGDELAYWPEAEAQSDSLVLTKVRPK